MAGRAETVAQIPGRYALSVGRTEMEAPSGWAWHRLLDIARLESGHTPSRKHPEYWDGEVPWVGIKDARIHHGRRIQQTLQQVTEAGLANSAARWLPAETVCLSRTASVGYVTVLDRPMATSQDFVNWICSDELDPEFLMWLFMAEEESLLKFGKGSTHTTIYFPEVKAFHVCAPPRVTQRRIVEKIEALTAKSRRAKEALDAIPALLERFRQSVLAAAFRGDLTKDWREQHPDVEPADQLLARIRQERRHRWEEAELDKFRAKGKEPKNDNWKQKYKEPEPVDTEGLPELPRGWCWVSVAGLCERVSVGHVGPTSEYYCAPVEGVPFVRSQNVRPGLLDLATVQYVTRAFHMSLNKSRLCAEDVLVVRVGANRGDTCQVPAGLGELNCANVVFARPVRAASWLSSFLQSPLGRRDLLGISTGSAQGVLNTTAVATVRVPLAPEDEQAVALRLAGAALERASAIEERVRSCAQRGTALEPAILAKAFRGELVEPTDD